MKSFGNPMFGPSASGSWSRRHYRGCKAGLRNQLARPKEAIEEQTKKKDETPPSAPIRDILTLMRGLRDSLQSAFCSNVPRLVYLITGHSGGERAVAFRNDSGEQFFRKELVGLVPHHCEASITDHRCPRIQRRIPEDSMLEHPV